MTAHSPVKADPIGALMQWVEGSERSLRRRLLAFQHRASSRARLCENDRARSLWWIICDTAADNAFAPAAPAHLEEVLRSLTYLSMAADSFQNWEDSRG